MKNLLKKELKKKIYTLTTSLTSGMRSFNACSIPILRVIKCIRTPSTMALQSNRDRAIIFDID